MRCASVVSRCDPLCGDRIGLANEIAEFREGVAAHTWNRSSALCVFAHEVVDDVLAESRLEIDHVVRHAKLLANASGVVDGIERAARPIGNFLAVTKQLHRRADYFVSLIHEESGGNGGVDSSGHCNQNTVLHQVTAENCRALLTSFG